LLTKNLLNNTVIDIQKYILLLKTIDNIHKTKNILMQKLKLVKLEKLSVIYLFFFILTNGCSGTKPTSIGQFINCPDKPNCISSKSSSSSHTPPLTYQGSTLKAKKDLLKVIESIARAKVSTNNTNFLHVEFTSKIFRFVDDVEFYFDEPEVIHFRSASRIGHSDMGINRDRMEEIKKLFNKISQEDN
jgi:uncharacterized protein (DUF1499 family)